MSTKAERRAAARAAATVATIVTSEQAATESTPAAAPAALEPPVAMQPVHVATAVHPLQQVVGLGKVYNVRPATQNDNVRSWQAICSFLAANGGSATVAQLTAHLQKEFNHANMVGYCVRRGYLAPVQQGASTPSP